MAEFKGLKEALDSIDAGVFILNKNKKVIFLNKWLIKRSPLKEDIVGKSFVYLFPQLLENRIFEAIEQALNEGYPSLISNIFNRTPFPLYPLAQSKQGTLNRIQQTVCVSPFNIEDSEEPFCLIQINDVTPAVMREKALEKQVMERRQAENNLDQERRLFMAGPSIVFKWKAIEGLPVEYISPNVEHQLGYNAEQFVNSKISFLEVLHPHDLRKVIDEIRTHSSRNVRHFEQEYRLLNSTGQYRWFHVVMMIIRDEDEVITHYHGYMQDITERKQAEAQIERLAYHDALTELPNRRYFLERLEEDASRAKRLQKFGAVLYLDLDRFKSINDTLGHSIGDQLLKEVAHRLRSSFRLEDTVARIGGDEFVIILTQLGRNEQDVVVQVSHVAEKIQQALTDTYNIADHEIKIAPSVGISLFGNSDETPEEIIKNADIAMYQAKTRGNCSVFFDEEMQRIASERLSLEKSISKAIVNDALFLNIQPQTDSTGKVIAAECLLRWEDPEKGLISPAVFIPIAEETGDIIEIGDWVIKTACDELEQWHKNNINLDYLAVNVSPKQFHQINFVSKLKDVIASKTFNPSQLVIEITENLFIQDIEEAVEKILQLKELGIRFAIDDFGTGYSSLSYLHKLPLDILKIDKSFVSQVHKNEGNTKIFKSIMLMAQNLNLDIIAEGVETKHELNYLVDNECEKLQGFYFYKPMRTEEFNALITDQAQALTG